ncbi:hypothetical protein [Melittangium boletus]|uniref:Uncharacterized protein n=1 Tax=Melittangium boletus DSM 14713 TaxID=1294270 RepID=A0A250IB84_9BACT|nr:hypothetical protein [Melittangium boletus]ATB28397.1 hypothetical protein MEBOL_001844 [Melittangium boletus DSM 14713]
MKTRELFWQHVIQKRHDLLMALSKDKAASFEAAEREYLGLQKDLLKRARTEWERRHIKRLISQDILNEADYRARDWAEFSRALRRMRRLGYMDADAQLHAACLTVWASLRFRDKEPLAWAMMEDAERRLRRIRRGHFRREEGLETIAHVRARASRKGLSPPPAPEPPRRRAARAPLRLVPPAE